MNVLLWVLQCALALLYLAGGTFKFLNPADLTVQTPSISPGAWRALGVFEVVGAILLVLPAALKWKPAVTPLAATALAAETLVLAVIFAQYSLDIAVTNPMTWAIVMGVLAACVAYGRYAPKPT